MQNSILKNDSLWYKNAIIYEVPVRAFADSNGDGIGDFRGLTEKLDYLQDLGVTAVWILPFFPSPLKDDGYDIADYTSVNPIYGTLADFQEFLAAAHQRGIRVIIELIINHTSDQHPWFQRARRAPQGSSERDFYVWSDTPEKYQEARIIFQDFETSNWTWDPIAKAYCWHRFYSHQPDLNYDNPDVQAAVLDALDFWMKMGVDAFRLDAIPYLYEREGTNCENLPETHVFLKRLRAHVDEKYPNRMLLAEANQWPEDAAQYYGDGDECHMNFHFPLMPRLFMALRMEDNFPIIDILKQTPPIPDNCQWGLFLRNHDELTLEMVTDEDRDYMWKVYAQDPVMRVNLGIRRRLAPLLGNDRRQIELLNSLLLSLPGTPVLYYGDEIGMGDNVYVGDRNGVRTPMQWSADRNAGFSRTNPQRLYLPVIVDSEYHYEAVNVEAQRANPNSLWYTMKRLIATRKRFQALGRGSFELMQPKNRKVLVFSRTYEDENILIVANLSRFVQTVELDLSAFDGQTPVEIFGQTEFPTIGESPYFLSLSPYGFYWFNLVQKTSKTKPPLPQAELPTLVINRQWANVFSYPDSVETKNFMSQLQSVLPDYLYTCSWFGGKTQTITSAKIIEVIPMGNSSDSTIQMIWLQVEYIQGNAETYLLPLAHAEGEGASQLLTEMPQSVLASFETSGGILYDASHHKDFLTLSLDAIADHRSYKGMLGKLVASATDLFPQLCSEESELEPTVQKMERTNTYVVYGDRLFLKIFRKLESGLHPDLEIRRFLSEKKHVKHFAPIAGALEYYSPSKAGVSATEPMTVGILQEYVQNTRNAWDFTMDSLQDYFNQVMTLQAEVTELPVTSGPLLELQSVDIPELATQTIGSYLVSAQLLGKCTAELHIALATETQNSDFAPEPFSSLYQRSIYQYARNEAGQVFLLLRDRLHSLPSDTQTLAHTVLKQQEEIIGRFQLILNQKITAQRTRYHGDYHLGQILYTGNDFIITHFEGRAARSFSERRMKRSPLRDVAGMLLSFQYAVATALHNEVEQGMIRNDNLPVMQTWSKFWYTWVSAVFVKSYLENSYLETVASSSFLPKTSVELQLLLDSFVLEKVINALGDALNDKLNNRPDWIDTTLRLILQFNY